MVESLVVSRPWGMETGRTCCHLLLDSDRSIVRRNSPVAVYSVI
jgi:hypothetical protein